MSLLQILLIVSIFHNFEAQTSLLPDQSQPNTCNSCCQGPTGLAGVPGVPGSPGSPGSNGLHGRDGFKGEAGMKGEIGEPGFRGPLGEQGLHGLPGKAGPRGLDGRPGAATKGEIGEPGLPGPSGERGPRGSPGSLGQPGTPGPKGEKGDSVSSGGSLQQRKSAFTVYKTSSQRGRSPDIVTFEHEQTNVGSHYDMATNKFTCEIPGTYVFIYTIYFSSGSGSDPAIRLIKDNTSVTSAFGRDYSSGQFHNFGNTAVLQLSAGNQVWLQFSRSSEERIYSDGAKLTSFSGFLLYSE